MGQSFKHEITYSLSSSLSGKQTDLSDNKPKSSHYSSKLNDQGQGRDLVLMSQLCKEQHYDAKSLPLLERAFDEKEKDQKGKRKVQGVPQSQTAALPRPQEDRQI